MNIDYPDFPDYRRTWRLWPVLLLLAVAGCFNNRADKDEREEWGWPQWREAQREDALRYLSEDERAKKDWLAETGDKIWDQIVHIYNFFTGNTPFNAAKNMLDPTFPDRRRQAIMELSKQKYGRQDPYLKYYAEMARTDMDHTVRAMAIRALNRGRVKDATAIYITALDDRHELVRMEAAKALANIPEPLALQGLMKRLDDAEESVDVRVACADALRCYKTAEAAQSLVRVLRDPQFGVAWQARKSLKFLTGRDYRYDQAAWLTYFSETPKPFG